MNLSSRYGISRSYLMYYGIPGRRHKMRQFYGQFIGKGDLCFDIGSHLGNRIRAFNDLSAKTIAVEPQPLFYRYIHRRFSNDNCTILNCAVSSKSGRTELHISEMTPTVSTISSEWIDDMKKNSLFRGIHWNRQIPINTTTLDALISRFGLPKFCKIDVEGMESEVLAGLTAKIPYISFEYLPANKKSIDRCIDNLSQIGHYRYNWSRIETMTLVSKSWLTGAEMASIIKAMPDTGRSGDIYAALS